MNTPVLRLLAFAWVIPCLLPAETVKDREGAVRQDRSKMESDKRWIYNDVAKGFEEAKKSGKPLLVVLRCVPCMSCMGMDSAVLTEKSLEPLLDQFVCVRLINANAIDLAQFQFDYDLSFSTMFFHGDGTVLGRYGSWTHQKNPYESTLDGYRRALDAVLALHAKYPGNKPWVEGKQGVALPFRTPVEIPRWRYALVNFPHPLLEMGLVILDTAYLGTRTVNLNNDRKIEKPSDLNGTKMRMPPGASFQVLAKALGSTPVSMPITRPNGVSNQPSAGPARTMSFVSG